jgi:hypothetical protein
MQGNLIKISDEKVIEIVAAEAEHLRLVILAPVTDEKKKTARKPGKASCSRGLSGT